MFSTDLTPARQHGTLRVVHLLKEYLPYSCSWIFHQITGPKGVEALTVAWEGKDSALEAFPNPHLTRLRRSNPLHYWLARPLTPLGIRRLSMAARSALEDFSPDLTHAHFGHYGWSYLPIVKAMRLPLVVSFYGHDMSELPRLRPAWISRYAELFDFGRLFFCEGPVMAAGLRRLGCPAEKIRIQRLGVDCSRVVVWPRYFEPGETLRVLLAARMTEKKGIPDAVKAVAAASRKIPIHLTIAGDAAPGRKGRQEEKRILQAIRDTSSAGLVTLTGRVRYDELFRIAREHHALIQPSRTSSTGDTEGGIPVTLIELGATGMTAVATRHADIPEVLRDAENGLLVDEGDVDRLADALVKLATTPQMVHCMGQAMARHITREFDQARCHAQLVAHYEEAVGR